MPFVTSSDARRCQEPLVASLHLFVRGVSEGGREVNDCCTADRNDFQRSLHPYQTACRSDKPMIAYQETLIGSEHMLKILRIAQVSELPSGHPKLNLVHTIHTNCR